MIHPEPQQDAQTCAQAIPLVRRRPAWSPWHASDPHQHVPPANLRRWDDPTPAAAMNAKALPRYCSDRDDPASDAPPRMHLHRVAPHLNPYARDARNRACRNSDAARLNGDQLNGDQFPPNHLNEAHLNADQLNADPMACRHPHRIDQPAAYPAEQIRSSGRRWNSRDEDCWEDHHGRHRQHGQSFRTHLTGCRHQDDQSRRSSPIGRCHQDGPNRPTHQFGRIHHGRRLRRTASRS